MSDEADFALNRAASSAGNAVNEQSLRRFGAQRQEEMNYQARQKNLAADLRNGGLDALLVTHLPNVRYLCGFTGTAGVLLVQAGARRGHDKPTDGANNPSVLVGQDSRTHARNWQPVKPPSHLQKAACLLPAARPGLLKTPGQEYLRHLVLEW